MVIRVEKQFQVLTQKVALAGMLRSSGYESSGSHSKGGVEWVACGRHAVQCCRPVLLGSARVVHDGCAQSHMVMLVMHGHAWSWSRMVVHGYAGHAEQPAEQPPLPSNCNAPSVSLCASGVACEKMSCASA
jgi:hypothetical protein